MKAFLSILLLALLVSCDVVQTKEEKVTAAVKKYLKTVLNDPRSYDPVSFDIEKDVDDIQVYHKFRAKNAFGALVLEDYEFRVSFDYQVTSARNLNDYESKVTELAREMEVRDSIARLEYDRTQK